MKEEMNMEEKLLDLRVAIAAAFAAMGAFLGWQGVLGVVWIIFVCADWVSGTWVARKTGTWSSAAAREGAMHKAGMLLVVIVSLILDLGMTVMCANIPIGWDWPWLVCPLVLAWYILTEAGSILENVLKLGADVPPWLTGTVTLALKVLNKQGEEIADKIAQDKREQEGIDHD